MLVLVVLPIVSAVLCFFFFDFLVVLFMVLEVSVLPADVFCAKTALTGKSERPRAAIMIFFIFGDISFN